MGIEISFIGIRLYFWKRKGIFMLSSITCITVINNISMVFFQIVLIVEEIYKQFGGIVGNKEADIFDNLSFIALILLLVNSLLYFVAKLIEPYITSFVQLFKTKLYQDDEKIRK